MEISSKNKTILVISDVHQNIAKMNYILKKENYDYVVHLGDFFDSFTYNTNSHIKETCNFIKEWIYKENFFTLISNHDIHYLYNNKHALSSGFNAKKSSFIKECFGDKIDEIRKKFLWYLWIDNYLCSHAGVHTHHFNPNMKINKQSVSTWLNREIEKAETALNSGDKYWLYCAGLARFGNEIIGGITWLDFEEEFVPIVGLDQIVGHTFHSIVIERNNNYCIDCSLNQYLIIENGKLTVKSYSEL
jgi:hypothetical protein